MNIEVWGASDADVRILNAVVPPDKYDALIHDLTTVLTFYSSYGVQGRKQTKRTVCKTNVRNALRDSYTNFERRWAAVNDDWLAAFYWDGWDWVFGEYCAELTNRKEDVTLTVTLKEKDYDEATRLLMDEYERYVSGEQE